MKLTAPRFPQWSAGAVAFLFALSAYLPRAWEGALRGDPLLYAAIARSAAERGAWTPLFFGEFPYLLKPPLMFWLISISFRIFGFNAFAARLPSILLAAGAAAILAMLASRWYGARTGRGAALVLALSYTFARAAASNRLESAVAFSLLGAAWAGSIGLDDRRNPLPWALAGVFTGLGLMAKGPVVLIAWPVIACEAAFRGRLRALFRPAAAGLLLAAALLVAAPWHIASARRLGPAFLEIYLGREVLDRLAAPGGDPPLIFYLRELALHYWPWLPFLAAALLRALRDPPPAPATSLRINLAFLALAFAAVLPVRPPYDRYLVPFLCAAAPLVAWSIERSAIARAWGAVVDRLGWIAAGAAVALTVVPVPLHAPMPAGDRAFLDAVRGASDHRYVWAYRYEDWETKALVLFYGERGVRDANDLARVPDNQVVLLDRDRADDIGLDANRSYRFVAERRGTAAYVPRRTGPAPESRGDEARPLNALRARSDAAPAPEPQ